MCSGTRETAKKMKLAIRNNNISRSIYKTTTTTASDVFHKTAGNNKNNKHFRKTSCWQEHLDAPPYEQDTKDNFFRLWITFWTRRQLLLFMTDKKGLAREKKEKKNWDWPDFIRLFLAIFCCLADVVFGRWKFSTHSHTRTYTGSGT